MQVYEMNIPPENKTRRKTSFQNTKSGVESSFTAGLQSKGSHNKMSQTPVSSLASSYTKIVI